MERAKTILTETLFSKSSNGKNDLVNLPGGRPLIADSLIYRLTFDPEDDDDSYHHYDKMIIDNNHLKSSSSSIDINDNDENMINVWSLNWDNNQHDDDHNNKNSGHYKINEPECPSTIFKSSSIKLNVSSLADEIIDSEMNSLKCLQIKPTTIESVITISGDNGHHNHQGLVIDDDNDDGNETNVKTINIHNNYLSKSTGQCPPNERKRLKSLILPSLMRGAINTETSIITHNCPPARACFSCCIIS